MVVLKNVGERIRTPVGISHWILSPARLATPALPHITNKKEVAYKFLDVMSFLTKEVKNV